MWDNKWLQLVNLTRFGCNTPAYTRSLTNASAFLRVFTLFVIQVWGVFGLGVTFWERTDLLALVCNV